jgi:hypothetical protein
MKLVKRHLHLYSKLKVIVYKNIYLSCSIHVALSLANVRLLSFIITTCIPNTGTVTKKNKNLFSTISLSFHFFPHTTINYCFDQVQVQVRDVRHQTGPVVLWNRDKLVSVL